MQLRLQINSCSGSKQARENLETRDGMQLGGVTAWVPQNLTIAIKIALSSNRSESSLAKHRFYIAGL